MQFSLGKPILVLMLLAAISGIGVISLRTPQRANLVVWCFADSHARTYRDKLPQTDGTLGPSLADQFQQTNGKSVQVDLISGRAQDVRLISLFMSQATGPQVPDLCEVEIGSIGQFFRPPVDDVGFLPLNDFLQQSGQSNLILDSRFAPWSKIDPRTNQRVIFGIPNDVHPLSITYRKDLFDEAGIDLSQAKTWSEFQKLCLDFQSYRASHGHPESRAVEMRTTNPSDLLAMLLQRHINIVDSNNHVHFTDPKTAETVAFYAQLVSGPRAINADPAPGILWADELANGNIAALITADWRIGYLKKYAPQLAGKLHMMPLPKFDDTDAPTSTAGGTMMGIPRTCKNPALAWKLLQFLYLSPQGNAARIAAGSNILPPLPNLWTDPVYHQPDAFYGGQKINELYASLAPQIPPHDVTPDTPQAELALTLVMLKAEHYVQTHSAQDLPNALPDGLTDALPDALPNGLPDGLTAACATWLAQTQTDIQRRIDFGKLQ